MEGNVFNWTLFWPGFDKLFIFNLSDTEKITNIFISSILCVFIFFLCLYFIFFIKYFYSISRIQYSISKKVKKNDYSIENAIEFSKSSNLSKMFYETMTCSNNKVYSNYDSEMYFNGKNLAPYITCSKIFPFIAVLLTGIGVLGTFFGLQTGLGGLHLDGNMEALQSEIRMLAGSASIAFVTSVWGVSSSLVMNFFEKFFSAVLHSKILSLQTTIDQLFPRFSAMDVFITIQDESEKTTDVLNGLAEQIGNNVQKSFDSFSETLLTSMGDTIQNAAKSFSSSVGGAVSQAIETTLVPTVSRLSDVSISLAERQASSSSEVMNKLLTEFMGKIGQEGDGQRQAMQNASQELRQTLASFSTSMESFFQSLSAQQAAFSTEQQSRAQQLDMAVRSLTAEQGQTLDKANQDMMRLLQSYSERMQEEQERQATALAGVSSSVRESMQGMACTMSTFFESLSQHQSSMVSAQDDRSRQIEEQMQKVFSQQMETLQEVGGSIAGHVKATMESFFQSQSAQQAAFSTEQQNRAQQLDMAVRSLTAEQGQTLDKANQDMMRLLQSYSERMQEEQERQATALAGVSSSVQESMQGMAHTMSAFFESLSQHQSGMVSEQDARSRQLEEQMQKVFSQQMETLQEVGGSIAGHVKATKNLLEQGGSLQNHVRQDNQMLAGLAKELSGTGISLQKASEQLQKFSTEIGSAVRKSAENVDNSLKIASNLANTYSSVGGHIENTLKSIEKIREGFQNTSSELKSSSEIAANGFVAVSNHYDHLQDRLREHMKELSKETTEQVKELDDHMTKILRQYGENVNAQVSDRMKRWDEETQNFCDQIVNVVQVMGEFVDSKDIK